MLYTFYCRHCGQERQFKHEQDYQKRGRMWESYRCLTCGWLREYAVRAAVAERRRV